jgi:NADH dehydrogenase [ubiquinone] 1 alpha subcomplex assembly factor 7
MSQVMSPETALAADIKRRIATAGPMPVSTYMELCLTHPEHGYYMTQDPFGRGGDFITAPEISQMFGELIGLWAADIWRNNGKPQGLALIELGPGRGTLMLDALRAAKALPEFRAGLSVHLVEASPRLRAQQRETLVEVDLPVQWHKALTEVPETPAIIIANEFFDALPVHQAVKQDDGWHERVVTLTDGRLAFGIAAEILPRFELTVPKQLRGVPRGVIYEWRPDSVALEISRRIMRAGGAALVLDYGHLRSDIGETLQAMRGHAFVDPLADQGLADLTAHVDFAALQASLECLGARTHGPIEQGVFLRRLGIEVRASSLKAAAPAKVGPAIDAAVARLTATGKTGMGTLFKVMGVSRPEIALLPGFN